MAIIHSEVFMVSPLSSLASKAALINLSLLLIIQSIWLFYALRHREKPLPCPPLSGFHIDLATYDCCGMTIGEPLTSDNGFFPDVYAERTIKDKKQGFEIGAKGGCLDYILIDLEHFPGIITRNGEPMPDLRFWDTRRVISELGNPCWWDEDGEEILLFYKDGRIETQIEFPNKNTARYIIIMCHPVLAETTDCQRYHSNKPCSSETDHSTSASLRETKKTSCPSCLCVSPHRPLPRSTFPQLRTPHFSPRTSPC